MSNICRITLTALLAASLAACSLAPEYKRPEQEVPQQWKNVQGYTAPLESTWWERFNDPTLSLMITEALKHNMKLEESLANVDAAAAQLGLAGSALLPNITGSASNSQSAASERTASGMAMQTGKDALDRGVYNNQAQLSFSWELDLWGKRRNQYTMLTNMLLNTAVGHQALRLEIAGNTAKAYFTLCALDMQLDIARRTLKTREDGQRIYEKRFAVGEITELDLMRVKAETETARQQVHSTAAALEQAEAALSVLLGRSPREIYENRNMRGKGLAALPPAPVLPAGVPSELLQRRPDIQAAEYMILAYNANIGAARAEFFPTISLTGILGSASAALAQLFTDPATLWSKSVGLTLPIFDGGYNWNNLKGAEAKKRAAVAAYQYTVQKAFQDIRTALSAQHETIAIVESNAQQVAHLRRAADVARLQYDNGYTDYLTLLDAERQLFSAELSLANAMNRRLAAVVDVCLALGGGWEKGDFKTGCPLAPDGEKLAEQVEKSEARK